MSDYDPRLVELYDIDNPDGPDHDFYRALADSIDAKRIVDLGCGTGMLTVSLVGPARTVVGVDPSEAMLAFARRRAGASDVEWVAGESRDIPIDAVDLAIMSGNVVQHIPDARWKVTLADLRGRMKPGGVLAFESRNPVFREWEQWTAGGRTSRRTKHGDLVEWMTVTVIDDRCVQFTAHNYFAQTDDLVEMTQELVFRSRGELTADLDEAGFDVTAVHGGWRGESVNDGSRLLVLTAHAR